MNRLRLVFAALALALFVFPLAGAAPLLDPDEGLHAAIAQEMVLRHDYVTPTFLGQPFLDKPILFFWAEALSLRAFGTNEAAVRIPPLAFGFFGMVSVAALARVLFGSAAALAAGIVYASMLLPLGVSEVAVHDVALIPFVCIAAACLVRASSAPRAWLWSVPMGVSLGLSILTKGLVGIVFVGMFTVCLGAARREAWLRIAAALMIALVLAAAVAAPWYVAMEHAHPGYLRYYFVERHLHGYLTATQRHAGRPWWYYLPIVVGGALPWTGYLAGAARDFRRRRGAEWTSRAVLWAWFAIGLVFLSAGESKLVTYVLPLFPALAILAGEHIVTAQLHDRWFRWAIAIQIAVLAILPAAAVAAIRSKFPITGALLWIEAAVGAALVAASAPRAWRAATFDGFLVNMTRAIASSVMMLVLFIAPRAAPWMSARDLAAALNESGRLPSRVSVLDERIGSLIFYLAPPLRADASPDRVATTTRAAVVDRLRIDAPDAIVAVRDDELARFQRLFPVAPQPERRAGTFTVYRVDRLRGALGLAQR